jgi:hypothetical protein
MADRPIEVQDSTAAEAKQAAGKMLDCLHSTYPPVMTSDGLHGPWQVDTIYKNGNTGDKWLAERTVDESGKESQMIRYRQDGMTYVDIINPDGKHPGTEELLVSDPYGAHPVDKGSAEEQTVLNAIHKINFDICPVK